MATKSILKNIEIRDKKFGRKFADAIEKAKTIPGKEVGYSRPYREVTEGEIKKLFS